VLHEVSIAGAPPEEVFIPPKSEGTRIMLVARQAGQSEGEGLSMERSHSSKRRPHCSHLYS
jgi:hypothetical protein